MDLIPLGVRRVTRAGQRGGIFRAHSNARGGRRGGERRQEWQDGGGIGTPLRAKGRQNGAGGFARRRERGEGVSRSRTRRGASGARRGRGGLRAERHTRERRERRDAPLAERACGGMAVLTPALARRAARRTARRGSCVRSGGGQGERSEGAGLRLRQRPAGRRPARYGGAEPHRRAEAGKLRAATWRGAGKRRMSVVPPQRASRLTFGAGCAAHAAGWNSSPRPAGRWHVARERAAVCRWAAGEQAA